MSVNWLNKRIGYLPGAVNVGVVRLVDDRVLLVDSGLDDDRARKILKALAAESLRPTILFLTHAHADHMGGAHFLRRRAGVRVVAPAGEADFVRRPYLEPFALYGLAEPPPDLQTKFLMARPTVVDEEVEPGAWSPQDDEFTVVDLAGHSPWQCGLLVDGVCFAGDSLFPEELWEKHGFVYQADVGRAFGALDRLAEFSPDTVVPAHGSPASPGDDLVERNHEELLRVVREVLAAVDRGVEGGDGGAGGDDLLALLARDWDVTFRGLVDYGLARATLHAHLTYLAAHGAVAPQGAGGRLLWLPTGARI